MGTNPGSLSSCKAHQWVGGKGVCPSCLIDRLFSLTRAISKPSQSTTGLNTASNFVETDTFRRKDDLSNDISSFSTADGSFSWQRSKLQLKEGNCKECFFDAEDHHRLCLVYFDSEAVDLRSHGRGKNYKPTNSGNISQKGRSHSVRSSSTRRDQAVKPGNKHRRLWAPSKILRRLFAGSRTSMDRGIAQKQEKGDDVYTDRESMSSAAGQKSDTDEIPSLSRVTPLTSAGCCDQITKTMKNFDVPHGFSLQCWSKGFKSELSNRPTMASSPLRIFSRKSQQKDFTMDLEKQFQGAATSWSRSNTLSEENRRQHSHLSPAHSLFFKDHSHSQCSFKSSPLQVKECRRKELQNRPGIFHLSPYSWGKKGWKWYISPLVYRKTFTGKHTAN